MWSEKSRHGGLVHLSERLLAFCFEDARLGTMADKYDLQEAKQGYHECLRGAAEYLQDAHAGEFMLVNLGGVLAQSSYYTMFSNSCVEFDIPWNTPIGPGVCPLDVLFATCSSIHNWLSMDEDHVAVLHTRCCPGGYGQSFLQFVAACYLTYTLEYAHVFEALEALEEGAALATYRDRRSSEGSQTTPSLGMKRRVSSVGRLADAGTPSPARQASFLGRGGARPARRTVPARRCPSRSSTPGRLSAGMRSTS